jgi:hypothetical protein
MEHSLFLAKIFGVLLTVLAGSLLASRKNLDLIFSIAKSKEFIFLTGVINILVGTYLILTHNVWEMNWRGVITLFGWAAMTKGLVRLLRPQVTQSTLAYFKKNKSATQMLIIGVLLLGLYLLHAGFISSSV